MDLALQFFLICLIGLGVLIVLALAVIVAVVAYYEVKRLVRGYRNN